MNAVTSPVCDSVPQETSLVITAGNASEVAVKVRRVVRVQAIAQALCAATPPSSATPCPKVLETPSGLELRFNVGGPVYVGAWEPCTSVATTVIGEQPNGALPLTSRVWGLLNSSLGTKELPFKVGPRVPSPTLRSSTGIFASIRPTLSPSGGARYELRGFLPGHAVTVAFCRAGAWAASRTCTGNQRASATVGESGTAGVLFSSSPRQGEDVVAIEAFKHVVAMAL